ncbi:OmpA family protein [Flavobacterium sp.]|uniref:OmpA family protein n=1 Tax=Flavobacterium sp. TaxID=239 RepID=UPI003753C871
MSKRTLYILGIALTIFLGSYMYPKFCCNGDSGKSIETVNPVLIDEIGKVNYNMFNLSGENFNYSCNENFKFLSNGFNNAQPVNDSINMGIRQLKSYFDKNGNQKLIITGYALNSEKNTSAFPNLGLARANDLKNYFISKGFDASKFETLGELRDTWRVSNDTVYGAAGFRIKQTTEIASEKLKDWNALKEKINANPLILYFNTNQTEINLTPEERQKIADLSNYLDHVPDAKITCVGHTDNVGNRDVNINLGQNRANFIKNYLSKNGISDNRIESTSKGPDEPIADNNSAEGKTKNRRTVVNLK